MSEPTADTMKRGPTTVSASVTDFDSSERPRKVSKPENPSAVQHQVQDCTASLGPASAPEESNDGDEKSSSFNTEEKKERKRKINRLSAQRKRVRERVQLDTLTDRYAQLSYRNEALKADNTRLDKLVANIQGTVTDAKTTQEKAATNKASDKSAYLLERLNLVEKVRQALLSSVLEGQPARLNGLDPTTGSAAGSTTENPFVQTTNQLVDKLKVIEHTRQTLISALKTLQPVPSNTNVGNLLSVLAATNTQAPAPVAVAVAAAVAQPPPNVLQAQLLSALVAPPVVMQQAPAAVQIPNAQLLLQLLAALGGSAGAVQPVQTTSFPVVQAQAPAPLAGLQALFGTAATPSAVSVASQPNNASVAHIVPPAPNNTANAARRPLPLIALSNPQGPAPNSMIMSQAPGPNTQIFVPSAATPTGSTQTQTQAASLVALLQLLQGNHGR